MGRCEGYYKLENHRCDRDGERHVRASDGETYVVCGYHGRQAWTTIVARWHGETGLRKSPPSDLRASSPPNQALAWG